MFLSLAEIFGVSSKYLSRMCEQFTHFQTVFSVLRVYALCGSKINIVVVTVFVFSTFETWANIVSTVFPG